VRDVIEATKVAEEKADYLPMDTKDVQEEKMRKKEPRRSCSLIERWMRRNERSGEKLAV
jgi:hypothetical protein